MHYGFAILSRRRRSRQGFTVTEVALALIIFAMMTIMFAAVFPMAVRGAQFGGNYTQAATLAQHKMDQLRSAGFSALTQSGMQGVSIIDSPQPSGYPLAVTGGTTYSFTAADGLVSSGAVHGYFPPGSQGTVTICDYAALHPSSGVPAGKIDYITVNITWTGGGVSNGSFSTSAMIAKTT